MTEEKIANIRNKIYAWYKLEKKDLPWRKTDNLFKTLVSEIFLQQTNTSSVKRIYDVFFNKYKNFRQIYETSEETLRNDIKSLGLANKRAKTLKHLSRKVVELNNGNPPKDEPFLENIKGIGDYISKAYLCFGLKKRTLFYDVNIERIVKRIFQKPQTSPNKDFILNILNSLVPPENFGDFYYALLDFGSKVCKRRAPKCSNCPLSQFCNYYLNEI